MSEYHVIRADGSSTIASFDRWNGGDAIRKVWNAAAKRYAVNLICLWPCGCLYRALVKESTIPAGRVYQGRVLRRTKYLRAHTGWRRVEACAEHDRKRKLGTFEADAFAFETAAPK